MMTLVQEKLKAGADEERLAFLVAAADKPRSCDGEPETKRFIVTTELQSGGANDAVSFGDRAITVTAVGAPARNASGDLEAWFDPQQPVTVTFTQLGGKTVSAEGTLPLHRSVVAGDSEYRFTALPGARGFLTVTADRRSEEHTSELQSLMRISYAVFCLQKKNTTHTQISTT